MLPQTINDYLALPYTIEVMKDHADDYSGWFAQVVELPGCMTQADTFDELETMIQDAMQGWLEAAMADNQSIPLPYAIESDQLTIRLPKFLHQQLARSAHHDGVSLKTFVSHALERAIS